MIVWMSGVMLWCPVTLISPRLYRVSSQFIVRPCQGWSYLLLQFSHSVQTIRHQEVSRVFLGHFSWYLILFTAPLPPYLSFLFSLHIVFASIVIKWVVASILHYMTDLIRRKYKDNVLDNKIKKKANKNVKWKPRDQTKNNK